MTTSFSPFERYVFEKLRETKLASVSAAVIHGEDVVWSRGFGYRNVEKGLPATAHTLYPIGSITKSFTCAAVMQLAERGLLTVDDPIAQYVPFDIQPGGEPIRIRHLMSHTSGIPALAYAEAVMGADVGATNNWLPLASYEDMLTFLADAGDWAVGKPGERMFYMNEGYVLLGMIVEKVSGMTYEAYVREHILHPLGMTRTFFDQADVEADGEAAVAYIMDDKGKRNAAKYFYGLDGPAGRLVSNVLDMGRYVSMYLGGGTTCGTTILPPSRVDEMQAHRIVHLQGGAFGDTYYGYGLVRIDNFFGHTVVGHSGGVAGAVCYMGFIPDQQLGVVVLTNGQTINPGDIGRYVLSVALGLDPAELPAVKLETKMKALEGTYETYKGTMKAVVRRQGNLLAMEFKDNFGGFTQLMLPDQIGETDHTFYTPDPNGYRLTHEFHVQDSRVDLLSERYLFRRTGPLPLS